MTLRTRLLLSVLVLSLATTFVLALLVRSAWHRAEADRFSREFKQATDELTFELSGAAKSIASQLRPLCEHDPIVDSALVGKFSGTLGSRLLSLRARIPDLERSLGLDALSLVGADGQVIAGRYRQQLSAKQLRQLILDLEDAPGLSHDAPRAFEAVCLRREGQHWVALLGVRHVAPLLANKGKEYGLELQFARARGTSDPTVWQGAVELDAAAGGTLLATRSRTRLEANLRDLDWTVASAAMFTLGGALLVALLLSRGLARPVMLFARKTREAVRGTVEELPLTGGPELEQAAQAFNATLHDLRQLRERLKVTEKIAARREIARQIAHEIKNPLSPIYTSLQTLQKLRQNSDDRFFAAFDETTATVLREVKRISTMVSHFAEYARVPSPQPQQLELEVSIEEAVRLHQGLGAVVEAHLRKLPPVLADRSQIFQVLTNLLKNALEATKDTTDATIVVTLDVSEGSAGGLQVIEVSDNGPGVPASLQTTIFEPYRTTKSAGSGLGLAISHRIAVEHGGDLTCLAKAGGGATFRLSLPVTGPPELSETPQL